MKVLQLLSVVLLLLSTPFLHAQDHSDAPKNYKGTSWIKLGVFGRKVGQGPAHNPGGQAGLEASLHSYRKTSDGLTRPFGILAGGEVYFASKHDKGNPHETATNVAFFAGLEFQGWQNGYYKPVWLIASLATRYHSDLSGNTDIKGLSLQAESLIKIRLPFDLLDQEPVVGLSFGFNFHPWGDAKFQPHIGVGFSFIFKAK